MKNMSDTHLEFSLRWIFDTIHKASSSFLRSTNGGNFPYWEFKEASTAGKVTYPTPLQWLIWIKSFIFILISTHFHPASWGVWPGLGGSSGWGALCAWCSRTAERISPWHAWPSANKRPLHSLHQLDLWAENTHAKNNKSERQACCLESLIVGNVVASFPQCSIIQTKRVPSSFWYFCSLPVTVTRCSASFACYPQWLHMLRTAWTMKEGR